MALPFFPSPLSKSSSPSLSTTKNRVERNKTGGDTFGDTRERVREPEEIGEDLARTNRD